MIDNNEIIENDIVSNENNNNNNNNNNNENNEYQDINNNSIKINEDSIINQRNSIDSYVSTGSSINAGAGASASANIKSNENSTYDFNKSNYYNNNVGVQITFENLTYKIINKNYKKQLKNQKKYEEQIKALKEKENLKESEVEIDMNKLSPEESFYFEENRNNNYTPGDIIEKELTILNNVSGIIEKGELTALFGPSGSGKSTLLDILAKRKSTGTVSGKLLVNGNEIGDAYKKYCSYVTQEEILLETSSVFETLKFHADLRLADMSEVEKVNRVNQVLKDIGLTKKSKSKIGGILPGGMVLKGLSGGEKKRVSIGCSLVTNPSLLLLDEPTSGLDSTSALSVMKVLQNLTKKGVTVVCSIHQPRPEIFALFKKIMVVIKGRMFYIGTDILSYLATLGYKCPNNINPADFCLDSCIEIADSPNFQKIVGDWEKYYKSDVEPSILNEPVNIEVPSTVSIFYQYKILQKRSIDYFIRNKIGFISRIAIAMSVGLLFSACFGGLANKSDDVQKILGALFFLMAALSLLPYACISTFISTRTLFNAERASKVYQPLPFFIASMIIEIIVGVIVSFIVVIIVYTISHLRWEIESFILTYIAYLFIHLFAVCMLIGISNFSGTIDLTFTYGTGLSVIYLLFAGFFVPVDSLPISFGWLHYLSPLHYGFAALVIAQFKDYHLECPPSSPTNPTFCVYPNGQSVIKFLDLEQYYYGEALVILIAWSILFFCLAFIAIKLFNKERR